MNAHNSGRTSHPLLEVCAFVTRVGRPTAASRLPAVAARSRLARRVAPFAPSDAVRTAVRDLSAPRRLQAGGPQQAGLRVPVDRARRGSLPSHQRARRRVQRRLAALRAADLARRRRPARSVRRARDPRRAPGTSYVFNPAGQVIDAGGLSACTTRRARRARRSRTRSAPRPHDATRDRSSIVWGTRALPGRAAAAARWYRELVAAIDGATMEDVTLA